MELIQSIALLASAAFPLMASPGPATLGLAATGAAFGVRPSVRYLVGICTGTMTLCAFTVSGLTSVFAAVPILVSVLAAFAFAYMLWLAWRIATAPFGDQKVGATHSPSFWGGYVLAIANPKAFAAFASATAAVTIAPASPTTDAAAKFATLAVMIWSINTSWLLFGSVFSGALARPHTARVVNLVFAALLLVSVGIAFWPAI